MTDNQLANTMRIMADLEWKFLSAILDFVRKVETTAGQPYSVAMMRFRNWLDEHGKQEFGVDKDGHIFTEDDGEKIYGTTRYWVWVFNGDVTVSDDQPYTYTDRYTGKKKVDDHAVFTFPKTVSEMALPYLDWFGTEPAHVVQYRHVGAVQTDKASRYEKYGPLILNLLRRKLVQGDVAKDIAFLESLRSGTASSRDIAGAVKTTPKSSQCDDGRMSFVLRSSDDED